MGIHLFVNKESNRMSLSDFEVHSKLGQGSYSSVYLVTRRGSTEKLALKKVKLDKLNERERQNSVNEVRILASIDSPYIVGYKDAFFDEATHSLCVVMEFVDGGDLLQKIREHATNRTAFAEEDVWAFAIQMLKGLRTLHEMSILHRDLKCANVFMSRSGRVVKIGDLNVAKVARNGFLSTQTGTPYYASPEVWRDETYNAKSDVWSLGCVLHEMLALKPPFRAPDMEGLFRKVQKGQFERIPARYSQELAEFVAQCLTLNPKHRPSCEDLLSFPCILRRIDLDPNLEHDSRPVTEHALLETIQFPKNMRQLSSLLPKPKDQRTNLSAIEEASDNEGGTVRESAFASRRSISPYTRVNRHEQGKENILTTVKKTSRPRAEVEVNVESSCIRRSRTPNSVETTSQVKSGGKLAPILPVPLIPAAIHMPNIRRRRPEEEKSTVIPTRYYAGRQQEDIYQRGDRSRSRPHLDRSVDYVTASRSRNVSNSRGGIEQQENNRSVNYIGNHYEYIYSLLTEKKKSEQNSYSRSPVRNNLSVLEVQQQQRQRYNNPFKI
eukprot:TRINITY_DN8570_c0_g3_i4.p1 TRINITY_DN8570_c0_g3~~TRINITY_DN8570_c0_g3_i4.p1  ORF type:complete len:552 (-),score=113.95 TRINITY_DN8570_c0_g3_i4:44-1699(-)